MGAPGFDLGLPTFSLKTSPPPKDTHLSRAQNSNALKGTKKMDILWMHKILHHLIYIGRLIPLQISTNMVSHGCLGGAKWISSIHRISLETLVAVDPLQKFNFLGV